MKPGKIVAPFKSITFIFFGYSLISPIEIILPSLTCILEAIKFSLLSVIIFPFI